MKGENMNSKEKKQEANAELMQRLPKGITLYTDLVHVSQSGLTRWIKPIVIINNEPINISYWVNNLFGDKQAEKNGSQCVKVGGCGMDMGFHLVYSISSRLHDDGYAINQRWI